MHSRSITYKDFDDEEVTETLYFNISKTELTRLEAEYKGGLTGMMTYLVKTEDTKSIMEQLENFILMSYGIKSADGKRHEKTDQIRADFRCSAAYDKLFWELFTNEEKFAEFLIAIIPEEAREDAMKGLAEEKAKVAVSPTPDEPTTPTVPPAPTPPTPPPVPQT